MQKNLITKIILALLLISLIITVVILGIKLNQKDEVKVYVLKGESENFSYTDGLFLNSSIQNIFSYGTFHIKNTNIKDEDIIAIEFKIDDDFLSGQNSIPQGNLIESTKYKELFKKEDYTDSKFTIAFTYFLANNTTTEIIDLTKERLLDKNNIQEEENSIGIDNSSDNEGKKIYEEQALKAQTLLNKGFTYNGRYQLERMLDDGSRISLRTDGSNFIYYNKDHNYRVESYIMHNIHIYTDDEMSFSYNANTKEITCHSKKCPNDAYEDIKDYLEIYNSLWN